MKRIISNLKNQHAISVMLEESQKEKYPEFTVQWKFFIVYFLTAYTDDESVLQMCLLQGLFPSPELEEKFPWYKRDDPNFFVECAALKELGNKNPTEIQKIILGATKRQSLVIAGHVANRLYEIGNTEIERVWRKDSYEELLEQISVFIGMLSPNLPTELYRDLKQKFKEVHEVLDKLYGSKLTA